MVLKTVSKRIVDDNMTV